VCATGDFLQTFFAANISDTADVHRPEIHALDGGVANAKISRQLFPRVPDFAGDLD
jgi:hypothetical protein